MSWTRQTKSRTKGLSTFCPCREPALSFLDLWCCVYHHFICIYSGLHCFFTSTNFRFNLFLTCFSSSLRSSNSLSNIFLPFKNLCVCVSPAYMPRHCMCAGARRLQKGVGSSRHESWVTVSPYMWLRPESRSSAKAVDDLSYWPISPALETSSPFSRGHWLL